MLSIHCLALMISDYIFMCVISKNLCSLLIKTPENYVQKDCLFSLSHSPKKKSNTMKSTHNPCLVRDVNILPFLGMYNSLNS